MKTCCWRSRTNGPVCPCNLWLLRLPHSPLDGSDMRTSRRSTNLSIVSYASCYGVQCNHGETSLVIRLESKASSLTRRLTQGSFVQIEQNLHLSRLSTWVWTLRSMQRRHF